jgi:hypothetical protein
MGFLTGSQVIDIVQILYDNNLISRENYLWFLISWFY